MDLLKQALDIVLHLQDHLNQLLQSYGSWFYGLLFLVIFAETGLVVTPFLPGDSLLFAIGALAADKDSGLSLATCAAIIAGAVALNDDAAHFLAVRSAMAIRDDLNVHLQLRLRLFDLGLRAFDLSLSSR